VARTETDIPAEEFLRRFEAYDLPDWDHYTHIRIAYLMLEKYGRREGIYIIYQGDDVLTQACRKGQNIPRPGSLHRQQPKYQSPIFPCQHDVLLDSVGSLWDA